ncbi:hypothetical protein VU01_12372 [Candidatus Electrothrix marina]|uniref:Uncharacterized protein n=1 Tax=Candidatus Electrothrix marina TaxID=1859130 RepID=A0A444JD33_9BACT|nr:hypothetical protein VU01_12372 [Candidatus Electrothrix marina]
MNPELEKIIHTLCDNLSQLWSLDSFKADSSIWREASEKAFTEAEETARKLPVTGRVIRGFPGVKVNFSKKSTLKDLITKLLYSSDEKPETYHSEQLQEAFAAIQKHISSIDHKIDENSKLSYRLKYPPFFKEWSCDEYVERMQEYKAKYPNYTPRYSLGILQLIAEQLVLAKFDPSTRQNFYNWQDVKKGAVNALREIEQLNEYHYEVRIFFNGPLIDQPEDIPLYDLSLEDNNIQIFLGYATDDLLTSLSSGARLPSYTEDSIIGIEKINTVARYRFKVQVEAGRKEYNIHYGYASYLAEMILDSLRLCRPMDDIGIIAIEIYPLSPFAPHIRKAENYAYNYQSYMAPYTPKRFDFSHASESPITDKELESINRIISIRLGQDNTNKKIEYAIKRFRNSIERYSPDDPERLLEYAIALEAIYLNDNGTERGELTYRLRLRVARFLKENYEDRDNLFKLIGDLYSLRSRIAHGEDISSSKKQKDKEKLQQVLNETPGILSKSILKIMNEYYEEHNTKEPLFWRKIELQ